MDVFGYLTAAHSSDAGTPESIRCGPGGAGAILTEVLRQC